MIYKPYFFDLLFASSIFYYACGIIDFFITMEGLRVYGYSFFAMENNEYICYLLRLGIPPIHMFIIPLIIVALVIYVQKVINKVYYNETLNVITILTDKAILGIWFATMLITMMGLLHLWGFISWFYYGAF